MHITLTSRGAAIEWAQAYGSGGAVGGGGSSTVRPRTGWSVVSRRRPINWGRSVGTGGATPTVGFTTSIIGNSSLVPQVGVSMHWSWFPLGRLGNLAGITPIEGTTVANSSGQITATGMTAGAGLILIRANGTSAATDDVYYEAGTAA